MSNYIKTISQSYSTFQFTEDDYNHFRQTTAGDTYIAVQKTGNILSDKFEQVVLMRTTKTRLIVAKTQDDSNQSDGVSMRYAFSRKTGKRLGESSYRQIYIYPSTEQRLDAMDMITHYQDEQKKRNILAAKISRKIYQLKHLPSAQLEFFVHLVETEGECAEKECVQEGTILIYDNGDSSLYCDEHSPSNHVLQDEMVRCPCCKCYLAHP